MAAVNNAVPRTLAVSNVSKSFGGVRAINDVSVSFAAGEIVSIIGPNGAGKTSLLNTISGFYRPDAGQIMMGDVDITDYRPSDIARIGVARTFQNIALFTGLTVIENVMLGRHVHMRAGALGAAWYWGRTRREELANRAVADDMLGIVGLSGMRDMMFGELAYGMRKRVELARALALEPKVLLLDEPMGGMNQDEKAQMCKFITDINARQNTTIVLIEHDMGVVMGLSDRVVVIERGTKIAEGTPKEIQHNEVVIQAYLGTRRSRAA